jgi:hypothetical protein
MENMTITQFLVWVAGGGATIMASWVLERIAWYQGLASDLKRWIFFGVASVFGFAAYFIGAFVPVEVLNQIAPFFLILSSAFSYVFLGSAFHEVDRIPEERI